MSAANEHVSALSPPNFSTERVRRRRERRRNGYCLFTVEVPQNVIDAAIKRGLLDAEDCKTAWKVIQACSASMLSDKAIEWLVRNRVIKSEQRADAVDILRGISIWLERLPT